MSTRRTTDQLIESLAADARPVRPTGWTAVLWPWVLVAAASIAELCHGFFGCRGDLAEATAKPLFAVMVGAWLVLGAAAAYRAVISSLPARRPRVLATVAIAGALTVLIVGIAFTIAHAGWRTEWQAGTDPGGAQCTGVLSLLMLIPAILFWVRLRPLAPTSPGQTAAWGLVATGAAAAAGLSFVCGSPSALHLLLWHALPIGLFALGLGLLSRRLWRW